MRETDRLSAFVHGIARNTANNYVRTRFKRPALTELPETLAAACKDDPAESAERRQFVIARSPQCRDRSQNPDADAGRWPEAGGIAERLGLNGDVVRTRKSRALRKVIDYVKGVSRT